MAWWTFPVRCRCGPSSLLGPHSDSGLPFPPVTVAALLSLAVLLFAAGLHLSTAALTSPSVLLAVAVAGLLLLSSPLDMGDPLPLPWPLEALAADSARLLMLSRRVWQCPVERQGLALCWTFRHEELRGGVDRDVVSLG